MLRDGTDAKQVRASFRHEFGMTHMFHYMEHLICLNAELVAFGLNHSSVREIDVKLVETRDACPICSYLNRRFFPDAVVKLISDYPKDYVDPPGTIRLTSASLLGEKSLGGGEHEREREGFSTPRRSRSRREGRRRRVGSLRRLEFESEQPQLGRREQDVPQVYRRVRRAAVASNVAVDSERRRDEPVPVLFGGRGLAVDRPRAPRPARAPRPSCRRSVVFGRLWAVRSGTWTDRTRTGGCRRRRRKRS